MASAVETRSHVVSWTGRGERQRGVGLGLLAVLVSLLVAALVLRLEFAPALAVTAVLLVAFICRAPRIGIFAVYGLILLFETASRFDPLMSPGHFLHSGVASNIGVIVSPLELLLVLMLGLAIVRSALTGRALRGGPLMWPMIGFFVMLVYGLVRGASSGGDSYIGFWEARAFFYLVLGYFVTTNTIETRRDLGVLLIITMLTTSAFAVEGAYRRVALVDSGQLSGSLVYEHEDAVFLGVQILVVVALHAFGAPRWQRVFGTVLVPIVGFTLFASERRAGMIGTMIAFLVFSIVFLSSHRRAFWRISAPIILVSAIYLPLFWNNTGLIGQPARAVRSISDPGDRDASSNEARDLELVNVQATIQSEPLLGIGFGREYLKIVAEPDMSAWEMWGYEAHHNILWVWLKTGAAGFIIFWLLMGHGIARAARTARVARDPQVRAYALLVLGGVVGSLVYSYVDTGLTSGRLTVFVGILLGGLAATDRLLAQSTLSTRGTANESLS